jgi:hypothetical protein
VGEALAITGNDALRLGLAKVRQSSETQMTIEKQVFPCRTLLWINHQWLNHSDLFDGF